LASASVCGPTVEGQFAVTDSLTIRGSFAGGLSATGTSTIDGLDYSISADIGATTLLGTYHLPAGLRLSGGVLMSNTTVSGSVSGSAGDTIGGFTVPTGQSFTVESSTEFTNSIAPMATVGFDLPIFGFVMSTDAGLVRTGGVNVTLTETSASPIIPTGDLTTAETSIESELAHDYIPYVSFTVGKWFCSKTFSVFKYPIIRAPLAPVCGSKTGLWIENAYPLRHQDGADEALQNAASGGQIPAPRRLHKTDHPRSGVQGQAYEPEADVTALFLASSERDFRDHWPFAPAIPSKQACHSRDLPFASGGWANLRSKVNQLPLFSVQAYPKPAQHTSSLSVAFQTEAQGGAVHAVSSRKP